MKLLARKPHETEWPVCRMLLPETFTGAYSYSYLLFLRDEAPHFVAAAAYQQAAEAIVDLRVHVVHSFRRQGVGSQIIEHFVSMGARTLECTVEVHGEQRAEVFCRRNLFERKDALTTVEAEIPKMLGYLRRLCSRIVMPPNACIIPLSEAPMDQVARLHAEYIAHESELNPWRARIAGFSGMENSPVAILDGQVAGILLGRLEGETAVVHSRVVAPGHQGGWVNSVLLARGLEYAWNKGGRCVRFYYTDSNRDTHKLAARFQARIVSVLVRFSRRCRPEAPSETCDTRP